MNRLNKAEPAVSNIVLKDPFINNLANRFFRNKVNLQYKNTAGSVLLSLFMRTNGKCNNTHAPLAPS